MEARSIAFFTIGLLAAGHALAGTTLLRQSGHSDTLRALAAAAFQARPRAAELALRPTPRVGALLQAAAMGAQPQHALPSAAARAQQPLLLGAGTAINVEGMRAGGGQVAAAVGDLQYVQLADGMMTVYRKHDGAALLGPVQANAMFADAPHDDGARACAAPHGGAVALLFDQLAKRWVLWHRAATGGNAYYLCIAVSTTSDAAARYYRHALPIEGAAGKALYFDDPQLALWPDAYYVSVNLFDGAQGAYLGPRVCGIERQALLRGADAQVRCRDLGAKAAPLAAASLAGYAVPARGGASPALFLSLALSAEGRGAHLLMWRFSYAANRLEGPLAIPVAPFIMACPAGDACIAQPAPGAKLAGLGERLMPHPVYRNDDERDSLVASHAVQMPEGQLGVRWYEIREPFGAPRAYQQGSFAPDSTSRWSASIGMDKAGNIAIGYSAGAIDTPPGIRYSGRERTDPPGRMRAEHVAFNGSGVEPGPGRGAAASGALALDPIDGCTFWYTQRYLPSTGAANWHTRIASLKFEACR